MIPNLSVKALKLRKKPEQTKEPTLCVRCHVCRHVASDAPSIVVLSLVCFFLFLPPITTYTWFLQTYTWFHDHLIQFPHAECAVVYQQVMDVLRQCPEESEDAYELQTILQKPNLRVSWNHILYILSSSFSFHIPFLLFLSLFHLSLSSHFLVLCLFLYSLSSCLNLM